MGVNYSEIIERMRWAGRLKNDSAVARALGVTPQALSNYKKRGEMPTDLALRFSNIYGLSMDWLLTGEGETRKPGRAGETASHLAAEETALYGKGEDTRGAGAWGATPIAGLSPDEIIYVGKLLKMLRGPNKSNALAVRYTIDAFLKASEEPQEKPAPGAQPSAPLETTAPGAPEKKTATEG